MDRPRLKKWYHAAIAAAFGAGFAVGYTLRNPEVTGAQWPGRQVRDIERDFPGAGATYRQLLNLFAQGDQVRADYEALLERVEEAMAKEPRYVPFAALRSAIWEDWLWNVKMGRYGREAVERPAKRAGLSETATTQALVDACRAEALKSWLAVESSPLVSEQEKYGERWRVLWEQHTNALRETQVIRTPVDDNGMADLTRAFNVFALTRDFVRYPNNVSDTPEGYSLEEKHVPDVVYCPQHGEVMFQLPCLPHLTPLQGGTVRRDLELFRTGMRIDGQKLDVEPVGGRQLHLLAFNTTRDPKIVTAQVRIRYADSPDEVVRAFAVPPWRQTEAMLRDPLARHALDAVHRDSEVHLANGSELNFPAAPFYLYHVTVGLDAARRVDEIYFPEHDPTTAGLEDPAINEVCILAMTIR